MQKTIDVNEGDALLAQDVELFEPAHTDKPDVFYVYPSRRVPRFIVRSDDDAALKFFTTLVSVDRGVFGLVLRFVARIYFVPRLLMYLVAERFVPVASHDRLSFVVQVKQFVYDNRLMLSRAEGELRVAKFCQRIAGPDTKILFLVSDQHGALCVVKTMRSPAQGEKLRRESFAQRQLKEAGIDFVPRVLFDGEIDGRYVYAEDVVDGIPISRRLAHKKEKEIVEHINRFPVRGIVSTRDVATILADHAPEQDPHFDVALERLQSSSTILKTGLTHGDLGRVNILQSNGSLHIIDWGRAGERPFYLIDAVYLLTRVRDIKNANDFKHRGAPVLTRYTDIDEESAEALYDILMCTEILYKKYPERYCEVTKQFSSGYVWRDLKIPTS